MLPARHLKQINHDPQLAARRGGEEWSGGCEKGASFLPDTFHFGITSHNRVIISSLSLSAALPLSLEGDHGVDGDKVWGRIGGGSHQE